MTYQEAKDVLRDAIGPRDELDVTTRLLASPGRLSVIDASTADELPKGDTYGDQVLRSLMVVWRPIAAHSLVERDLLGILVLLETPIRVLAETRETPIPGFHRSRSYWTLSACLVFRPALLGPLGIVSNKPPPQPLTGALPGWTVSQPETRSRL
jgi:hypothetical protein